MLLVPKKLRQGNLDITLRSWAPSEPRGGFCPHYCHSWEGCRVATGSSAPWQGRQVPTAPRLLLKIQFFGTIVGTNPLQQSFAVALGSQTKPHTQQRVNSCCCCLPSLLSVPARRKLEPAVQVQGWLCACLHSFSSAAEGGSRPAPGRLRWAASNPPLAAATGMARASECRNSLLYYYSIKFALSTYATLFSVGAAVACLSLPVFPPATPPPRVRFDISASAFPPPRRQILVVP